jgi:OmcA/MtrC family decaheme c-type cytochrome
MNQPQNPPPSLSPSPSPARSGRLGPGLGSETAPPGVRRSAAFLGAWLAATFLANAQTPPNWEASESFRYNILDARLGVAGMVRTITVTFSVTDPTDGNLPWNLKVDAPFTLPGARLTVDVGWSTRDYHNTGSTGEALTPVAFGRGIPAAPPISVNALAAAPAPNGPAGTYQVVATLPSQAFGTAVVALEGHPMWPDATGALAAVPVKSAYRYVAVTDSQPVPRRQIVDIAKCQACHNDQWHDKIDQVIPRLTLHGANRTEELGVCVICHNANQTDIGYRTSGTEVAVDFKTMIHAIHGNKRREQPLVVVGFRGNVVDFGDVEFPANPRDCYRCHIEQNGKGTYELPLAPGVLGTTIDTRSTPGVSVDVDPANNLRITPTAAVCSSCHDSPKARTHMASAKSGGKFGVLQSQIDSLAVKENCVSCHGPGKDKSVRKVHR